MLISQVKEDKDQTKPIHVKVTDEVKNALQENANLYANGNLSEWLRFAGLHFKPGKEHLVQPSKPKTKSKKK